MADSSPDKNGDVEMVKRLHATTDAAVWAHEFNKVFAQLHEGCELDEGWLIGWFANAIETGRGAARSSTREPMPAPLTSAQLDAIESEARAGHPMRSANFIPADVAVALVQMARSGVSATGRTEAETLIALRMYLTGTHSLDTPSSLEERIALALGKINERLPI